MLMSLLRIADSLYVPVRDLAGAAAWYMAKLGLRQVPLGKVDELDDSNAVGLSFSSEGPPEVLLGPVDVPKDESTPMFYTSHIRKAWESLNAKGISVTGIEQDRQGTRYFEFRDCEGNAIEVSEEPQ
jgi:predicted enzyme related to lactoylglutathione lyase